MLDESGFNTLEETTAVNPYGDVALGVECAWPESITSVERLPESPAA
jgi:hypothetical protein